MFTVCAALPDNTVRIATGALLLYVQLLHNIFCLWLLLGTVSLLIVYSRSFHLGEGIVLLLPILLSVGITTTWAGGFSYVEAVSSLK